MKNVITVTILESDGIEVTLEKPQRLSNWQLDSILRRIERASDESMRAFFSQKPDVKVEKSK